MSSRLGELIRKSFTLEYGSLTLKAASFTIAVSPTNSVGASEGPIKENARR